MLELKKIEPDDESGAIKSYASINNVNKNLIKGEIKTLTSENDGEIISCIIIAIQNQRTKPVQTHISESQVVNR